MEEKNVTFEVVAKEENLDVKRLFGLYKQDRESAFLYFNISGRGRFVESSTVLIKTDKSYIFKYRQRQFGISKTKKIYSREKEIGQTIISKKGVFKKSGKKIIPLRVCELTDFEIITYKKEILNLLPQFEWFFNFCMKGQYVLNIFNKPTNYYVNHKITNLRGAIRHFYKGYNVEDVYGLITNGEFVISNFLNDLIYYSEFIENKNHLLSFSKRAIDFISNYSKSKDSTNVRHVNYFPFTDTLRMCKMLGMKFSLKNGINKTIKIHDELSETINDLTLTLSERQMQVNDVFRKVNVDGLELIDNTKKLAIEGKTLSHCVYSYVSLIESSHSSIGIFHIDWNGFGYTLELDSKLEIKQFRGYKNCNAPEDLYEYIKSSLKKIIKEIALNGSDEEEKVCYLPF